MLLPRTDVCYAPTRSGTDMCAMFQPGLAVFVGAAPHFPETLATPCVHAPLAPHAKVPLAYAFPTRRPVLACAGTAVQNRTGTDTGNAGMPVSSTDPGFPGTAVSGTDTAFSGTAASGTAGREDMLVLVFGTESGYAGTVQKRTRLWTTAW